MGWSFFKSSGDRKVANFNNAPATPVGGTTRSNPAGTVVAYLDYFNQTAPTGWLLCDGQSYATSTYPDLFAQIQYTYGGAGASFNVPNLAGRAVMGDTAGAQDGGSGSTGAITGGTAIAAQAVGTAGGASRVKLTSAQTAMSAHQHPIIENSQHKHLITDLGHKHNVAKTNQNVGTGASPGVTISHWGTKNYPTTSAGAVTLSVDNNTPSFTVSPKELDAELYHDNMQPYVALMYIIKT